MDELNTNYKQALKDMDISFKKYLSSSDVDKLTIDKVETKIVTNLSLPAIDKDVHIESNIIHNFDIKDDGQYITYDHKIKYDDSISIGNNNWKAYFTWPVEFRDSSTAGSRSESVIKECKRTTTLDGIIIDERVVSIPVSEYKHKIKYENALNDFFDKSYKNYDAIISHYGINNEKAIDSKIEGNILHKLKIDDTVQNYLSSNGLKSDVIFKDSKIEYNIVLDDHNKVAGCSTLITSENIDFNELNYLNVCFVQNRAPIPFIEMYYRNPAWKDIHTGAFNVLLHNEEVASGQDAILLDLSVTGCF